jgi:hypothetical protein
LAGIAAVGDNVHALPAAHLPEELLSTSGGWAKLSERKVKSCKSGSPELAQAALGHAHRSLFTCMHMLMSALPAGIPGSGTPHSSAQLRPAMVGTQQAA